MQHLNQSTEIKLLNDLLRKRSVTPDDAGCQDLIIERLKPLGFHCETLQFGDVRNLWARRGTVAPVLVFAGHTDVVPSGDRKDWQSDPFEPTERNGHIYGRGSADMKSGLSAMIVAAENFVSEYPDHLGSIAFLITSDEEGRARDGTLKVIETLQSRNEKLDWCIVGEPSSTNRLGDNVRVGRRGSLSGQLTVHGIQGHVAYPQLADNPITRAAPLIAELTSRQWDKGNAHFPPTSFQIVDIRSGAGAPNVTPAEFHARFNFRYSTVWNHEQLRSETEAILDRHKLNYELNWHLSGEPFLTKPGKLIDATSAAIEAVKGTRPELSTGGGTSDGRFIAPAGVDVVEVGPINATIHKVNECVCIQDVIDLRKIYEAQMHLMLVKN